MHFKLRESINLSNDCYSLLAGTLSTTLSRVELGDEAIDERCISWKEFLGDGGIESWDDLMNKYRCLHRQELQKVSLDLTRMLSK